MKAVIGFQWETSKTIKYPQQKTLFDGPSSNLRPLYNSKVYIVKWSQVWIFITRSPVPRLAKFLKLHKKMELLTILPFLPHFYYEVVSDFHKGHKTGYNFFWIVFH